MNLIDRLRSGELVLPREPSEHLEEGRECHECQHFIQDIECLGWCPQLIETTACHTAACPDFKPKQ